MEKALQSWVSLPVLPADVDEARLPQLPRLLELLNRYLTVPLREQRHQKVAVCHFSQGRFHHTSRTYGLVAFVHKRVNVDAPQRSFGDGPTVGEFRHG